LLQEISLIIKRSKKLLESFVAIAMNYFVETDASMFLNKKDEKITR